MVGEVKNSFFGAMHSPPSFEMLGKKLKTIPRFKELNYVLENSGLWMHKHLHR